MEDYNDIIRGYDPSKNTTKNILSKYEKVKIIGVRAVQLMRGAEPLVKWEGEFDAKQVATQELMERKLPFMLARKLPNGQREYYRLDDMIIM
jgi:DNA-directed RNA polymerase subunit K/omega